MVWKDQQFWRLGGNSEVHPLESILGTKNSQSLEIQVNSQRAMRYDPTTGAPNLTGGYLDNSIAAGVQGGTISGGGGDQGTINRVTDHYGLVGGGSNNTAGNGIGVVDDANCATVGGGLQNTAGNSGGRRSSA